MLQLNNSSEAIEIATVYGSPDVSKLQDAGMKASITQDDLGRGADAASILARRDDEQGELNLWAFSFFLLGLSAHCGLARRT